jgi:DNA repair photolyase
MEMIVKEIKVKDYLTKSKIGEYVINPYVGCSHKCRYCYASFMKRFTNHSEPWGDFIDVKICDNPIDTKKLLHKNLFMSSVTDCYNPLEAKYKITRKILEQLTNIDCYLQIATKNKLILRDLDLLKQMKHLGVAMSVNTLDEKFQRDMDNASSITERLETLKTLHDNGIHTILFMSPIFIGITNPQAIIEQTKDYVDEYWFEVLNLRGSFKYDILNYIKTNYPKVYPTYEEIYIKNNKEKLTQMEKEIVEYCNKNNICYMDYFHHEEVINNAKNKILGYTDKQISMFD